jgi:hypothetical protein
LPFVPNLWWWEIQQTGELDELCNSVFVTYDESRGIFVGGASAHGTTRLFSSANGRSWNVLGQDIHVQHVTHHDIAAGNGKIVVMGSSSVVGDERPPIALVSQNLTDWQAVHVPAEYIDGEETCPAVFQNVSFGNGIFFSISTKQYPVQNFPPSRLRLVTSSDGINWRFNETVDFGATAVAFGNGVFTTVWNNTIRTTPNGEAWSAFNIPGIARLLNVTHIRDGYFAAVGNRQSAIFAPQRNIYQITPVPGSFRNWSRVASNGNRVVAVATTGTQNQRVMTLDFAQIESAEAMQFADFDETTENMYEVFYEYKNNGIIPQPVFVR